MNIAPPIMAITYRRMAAVAPAAFIYALVVVVPKTPVNQASAMVPTAPEVRANNHIVDLTLGR
jgi:hypothetical protein